MNGKPFTPQDIEILRKLYPDMASQKVAEMLGRPVKAVWNKAKTEIDYLKVLATTFNSKTA